MATVKHETLTVTYEVEFDVYGELPYPDSDDADELAARVHDQAVEEVLGPTNDDGDCIWWLIPRRRKVDIGRFGDMSSGG